MAQVFKDQELEQSEPKSSRQNQNGNPLNKKTVKIQKEHVVNRVSSSFPIGGHSATQTELKPSSPKGNDCSPECQQFIKNILNSSQESKTTKKTRTPFSPLHSDLGSFLDGQGQAIMLYVVQSGQNWNSSKTLCISFLYASLKRLR